MGASCCSPGIPPDESLPRFHGDRQPCKIDRVEERGISRPQLANLFAHIEHNCVPEKWVDWNGKQLTPDVINLYDVTKYVLKPLTEKPCCSYVELVSCGPQPPTWFVSHWWGEAVKDFISCIVNHGTARGLEEETAWWVCAYANNQHGLGADLGNDPRDSSFLKGMHISIGVLLILDSKSTPFSRIWCNFEESVSIASLDTTRSSPPLFDVTALVDGKAELLTTRGVTETEESYEWITTPEFSGYSQWLSKAKRERSFPLHLLRPALSIDVAKASAANDIDKVRILNVLAGRTREELDMEPDVSLPVYSEINHRLRSTFALALWRPVLQQRLDGSDISLPLATAVREDTARTEMKGLHLAGLKLRADDVLEIFQAVPPQLASLELDLSGLARFEIVEPLTQGLCKLTMLKFLELQLATSPMVEACGEHLGHGLRALCNLEQFRLDIGQNKLGPAGVCHIMKALSVLPKLTSLFLEMGHNFSGLGAECVMQALGECVQFEKLHLILYNNGIGRVETNHMCQSLSKLSKLTSLQLELSNFLGLTDAVRNSIDDHCTISLGQSLSALRGIESLSIGLEENEISDSGAQHLAQSISHLRSLTSVKLCLGGNKVSTDCRKLIKQELEEALPGSSVEVPVDE